MWLGKSPVDVPQHAVNWAHPGPLWLQPTRVGDTLGSRFYELSHLTLIYPEKNFAFPSGSRGTEGNLIGKTDRTLVPTTMLQWDSAETTGSQSWLVLGILAAHRTEVSVGWLTGKKCILSFGCWTLLNFKGQKSLDLFFDYLEKKSQPMSLLITGSKSEAPWPRADENSQCITGNLAANAKLIQAAVCWMWTQGVGGRESTEQCTLYCWWLRSVLGPEWLGCLGEGSSFSALRSVLAFSSITK